MSKTLFLGHFHENSSWSEMALDYALALSEYEDVVCRSVVLNKKNPVDPRLNKMLFKDLQGVKNVVQFILPEFMEYNGKYKNIAFNISETKSVKYQGWDQIFNCMDAVISPNNSQQSSTYCLHPPVDIEKYKDVEDFNIKDCDYKYKFYTIGEFTKRKRLSMLIRAYHTEFNKNDNCCLIIKTSKPGSNKNQTLKAVSEINDSIKNTLRSHNKELYQDINIIADRISDKEILGLHKYGDCFVSTSLGESWQKPAFDAMAMKNYVIAPNIPGPKDYLYPKMNSKLIQTMEDNCFGVEEFVKDIHCGKDIWHTMNFTELCQSMREAYENRDTPLKDPTERVSHFSYKNIGKQFKEIIDGIQ